MAKKEKTVVNIFWMQRDLRLEDNAALFHILKTRENVLPLYIFNPDLIERGKFKSAHTLNFVYSTLQEIKTRLERMGSNLLVVYGKPLDVFKKLIEEYHICSVYTNRDYTPYFAVQDLSVGRFFRMKGIDYCSYKDHVLFEKGELIKNDTRPYTVFTAYKNRFLEKYSNEMVRPFDTSQYYHHFFRLEPLKMPSLHELGIESVSFDFPSRTLSVKLLESYARDRDYPSRNGTSKLGIHLAYGTVSIRQITALAVPHSDVFLSELIWRNFFSQILWFYPHVVTRAFKPAYDNVRWENNQDHFQAWCEGRTGYPFVDAGMRELNQTGYMHNRLRMVTASFLCKHLLIDWRWGEAYFASKLYDYDLASNNGGWQWCAGSGCDASPYFRIFNPELQAQKFDPEYLYIRQWVPEIGSSLYPKPIVDHKFARERAIRRYGEGLGISAR
jgi:deoxyribodipyrimidine photo-lyase